MFGTWAEKVDLEPTGNLRLSLMRGDLARLSALFQDTHNPAAAWLCWYLAQKWGMPAPQPVADEINGFAAQIANLAIEALDGNTGTLINADVAGALWDTSPKKAKGKTRRGLTGLAEQLFLWDRDISLALRIHELRKGGLTEDLAVEKAIEEAKAAIEEAKKKNAKSKPAKSKRAESKKAKNKKAMNKRLKDVEEEDGVFRFDNAKRIGRKFRKDFLTGDAEAAEIEAEEALNAWICEKKGGVTRTAT
ncbi:hypothetical protein [Nitrobacter sp.]|uniref:hypothetical protein n=1 Tax=Nitrobacter sp. TaxID=29420 RepID=UPI003F64D560